MRLNPESLAKASSRHPWRTVGIWVILLVAGAISAATLLGPALTTDFDFTNSPEAKRAQQLLEDRNLAEDVITETFVLAAEPGAIMSVAVPLVVSQTTREKLPDDFGLAESNYRYGHLDAIVPRSELRPLLAQLLRLFART